MKDKKKQDEAASKEKQAKDALKKAKSELLLKKEDKVWTVPSDEYPNSVTLTINNITWNPNREDWMISFVESNVGTGYAKVQKITKNLTAKSGKNFLLVPPQTNALS